MDAELIAVGTELLLGEISNTDGQYISERLAELGINVYYHTVVGDNPARLRAVLEQARARSGLIITTGGLGPTYDDLTKETAAEVFGRKLVLHEPSLLRIRAFFDAVGREMTASNAKQAMLPEGCVVLENDWGTAPGCVIEDGQTALAMLPGPPRECVPMVDFRLVPYLQAGADSVILSHSVRVFGIGESAVEDMLSEMMRSARNPTIAPYAKEGEVLVRVTAKAGTRAEAESLIAPALGEITARLGPAVYGVDRASLEDALVALLQEKGRTLAAAESCTGGLLSARMTSVPGCSGVFMGGAVTYSNELKTELLAVPRRVLEEHGAVSAQVAARMAQGVCARAKSDIGISITGIAGPSGGSAEKPVGLVYIGMRVPGRTFVKKLLLGGPGRDRGQIRRLAASHALFMAIKYLGSAEI